MAFTTEIFEKIVKNLREKTGLEWGINAQANSVYCTTIIPFNLEVGIETIKKAEDKFQATLEKNGIVSGGFRTSSRVKNLQGGRDLQIKMEYSSNSALMGLLKAADPASAKQLETQFEKEHLQIAFMLREKTKKKWTSDANGVYCQTNLEVKPDVSVTHTFKSYIKGIVGLAPESVKKVTSPGAGEGAVSAEYIQPSNLKILLKQSPPVYVIKDGSDNHYVTGVVADGKGGYTINGMNANNQSRLINIDSEGKVTGFNHAAKLSPVEQMMKNHQDAIFKFFDLAPIAVKAAQGPSDPKKESKPDAPRPLEISAQDKQIIKAKEATLEKAAKFVASFPGVKVIPRVHDYIERNVAHNDKKPLKVVQFEFKDKVERDLFVQIVTAPPPLGSPSYVGNGKISGKPIVEVKPEFMQTVMEGALLDRQKGQCLALVKEINEKTNATYGDIDYPAAANFTSQINSLTSCTDLEDVKKIILRVQCKAIVYDITNKSKGIDDKATKEFIAINSDKIGAAKNSQDLEKMKQELIDAQLKPLKDQCKDLLVKINLGMRSTNHKSKIHDQEMDDYVTKKTGEINEKVTIKDLVKIKNKLTELSGKTEQVKSINEKIEGFRKGVAWYTFNKNTKADAIEKALINIPVEERGTALENPQLKTALAIQRHSFGKTDGSLDEKLAAKSFKDRYKTLKDSAPPPAPTQPVQPQKSAADVEEVAPSSLQKP